MEKVRTREDVYRVFEAGQQVKSLQMKVIQGIRENDPAAIWMVREIDRIRREIHQKYSILV